MDFAHFLGRKLNGNLTQPDGSRLTYGPWLWQIAQRLRGVANLPEADMNNFLGDLRRPDGLARMAVAARWASLTTPEESR